MWPLAKHFFGASKGGVRVKPFLFLLGAAKRVAHVRTFFKLYTETELDQRNQEKDHAKEVDFCP